MSLKERVIDVFEARVVQLITITDLTKLPQWIDADVIGADCLLKGYRKLSQPTEPREGEMSPLKKAIHKARGGPPPGPEYRY